MSEKERTKEIVLCNQEMLKLTEAIQIHRRQSGLLQSVEFFHPEIKQEFNTLEKKYEQLSYLLLKMDILTDKTINLLEIPRQELEQFVLKRLSLIRSRKEN